MTWTDRLHQLAYEATTTTVFPFWDTLRFRWEAQLKALRPEVWELILRELEPVREWTEQLQVELAEERHRISTLTRTVEEQAGRIKLGTDTNRKQADEIGKLRTGNAQVVESLNAQLQSVKEELAKAQEQLHAAATRASSAETDAATLADALEAVARMLARIREDEINRDVADGEIGEGVPWTSIVTEEAAEAVQRARKR